MDYSQAAPNAGSAPPSRFGLITIIYLCVGLLAIYYLYRYLYTNTDSKAIVLAGGKRGADVSVTTLPTIPTPFEGGDYSFSTWIYISSFNKNRNARKHIFELKGQYFSTLLVGLGAFNNTLVVRTHTKDASLEGFQAAGGSGSTGSGSTGSGSTGVTGNNGSGSTQAAAPTSSGPSPSAVPPNASADIGNLSVSAVNNLFTPMAMDDSLLTTPSICDLPEIDLQRWTMVTVVLSGRTIDVYMDGKLSRSCISPSYFKVDPTGVKPVMAARGGFDGYTGVTSVANYAMNPDEIYRAYLSGPEGANSFDIIGWFVSLLKGSN